MDWNAMRIVLAQAELRARDDAKRYAQEAREQGCKREARSWDAMAKRAEKTIALYGLERFAKEKPAG